MAYNPDHLELLRKLHVDPKNAEQTTEAIRLYLIPIFLQALKEQTTPPGESGTLSFPREVILALQIAAELGILGNLLIQDTDQSTADQATEEK